MNKYLNSLDQKRVKELYETRYSNLGDSYKTVGWGSEKDQSLRFDMLLRNINPQKKRILDIGCGLGHLISYIRKKHSNDFSYLGIDISESLIKHAKSKYKDPDKNFITAELNDFIMNNSSLKKEKFDICVVSGLFNFKVSDNILFLKESMKSLFNMTSECLSINLLSSYVDFEDKRNFHFKPEEVFSFSKKITKHVSLYHDYPLWEFTIQLNHNSNTFDII